MHILFVHYEWPGVTDCGGSGRQAARLRDELNRRGHTTSLVTDPDDGHYLTFPARRRAAIRRALADQPNVCLAGSSLPTSVGLPALCERYGVPLVVKPMGTDVHNPSRFTRIRPLLDRVNEWVFRGADRIITQSVAMRRHLPAVQTPVSTIPNGINPDAWDWQSSDRHDPVRVAIVGRLECGKAVKRGLRAVARLRTRQPAECRVVGDGPHEPQLRDSYGDRAWVEFRGWVDDVQSEYRWADVLLHPSDWESFGLVIIEAIACGTPVVSTDTGGQTDILRTLPDCGELRAPSVAALADGLLTVSTHYDKYQQATEGAISGTFDLATVGERYERVINRVAETTRASEKRTVQN
jgi:glycosyltransferase involved in cell wall biosynthesis